MPALPAAISAALATTVTVGGVALTVGNIITAAYFVGSAVEARRKAKAQARAARSAYEASLSDRAVMVKSAIAPRTLVYGVDRVSGPLVDAFTTGAKKQYLHLLVALAGRAVDGIPTVYLNEHAIEAADIDASGFVTASAWQRGTAHDATETVTANGSGVVTLAHTPGAVVVVERDAGGGLWDSVTYTYTSGNTVSGLTAGSVHRVTYTWKSYAPLVRIHKFLGDHTSVPSALLTETGGRRTSDHVGHGVAWLWVRLEWDQDVFGQIGMPNISALVRGHKVWDPRSSTTAWTDNSALCTADYMREATIGLGCTSAQVPDSELIAQANICDELVTLTAGGATQKRYTANGTLSAADGRLSNLDHLLESMAGGAVWAQGRWSLRAGAHPTPEPVTITVDHLADSAPRVQRSASRRDVVNSISATYRDPSANYAETQAPAVTNAAYVAQDGGRKVSQSVQLSMVQDAWRAQRLSKIKLERQRQALTCEIACNLRAFDFLPGQVVPVTIADYGWSGKLFEVRRRELDLQAGTVRYLLRETAAAVWDWAYGEATAVDPAPDTSLPNPLAPPAALSGITVASGSAQLLSQSDGTVLSRALVTWTQSTDAFVTEGGQIEIRWRPSDGTQWQVEPPVLGNATSAYVAPVPDGKQVIFSIRAVSKYGRASDWTSVSHKVLGQTEAPVNVDGVTGSVRGGVITWRWSVPGALNYYVTEVRAVDAGWTTYSGGTIGAPAFYFPLYRGNVSQFEEKLTAPGTYTRYFRHRNRSGVPSAVTATATITVTADDMVDGQALKTKLSVQTLADATGATSAVATLAAADANAAVFEHVLPAGTYKIDSSITFTKPVTMLPGALLQVSAGVAVAFNGGFQAEVQQCWDLASGAVVTFDLAKRASGYAEWWGMSDNVKTAAAINAALVALRKVELMPRDYFVASTIYHDRAHHELVGAGSTYDFTYGTHCTRLLIQDATSTCLHIGATSPGSSYPSQLPLGIKVRGLQVARDRPPEITSGCAAIRMSYCIDAYCEDVRGEEGMKSWQFVGTVACRVTRCLAKRTATGTIGGVSAPASDSWVGYDVDGTTAYLAGGNASLYITECSASDTRLVKTQGWGYSLYGSFTDTFLHKCESVACQVGVRISGTSATGTSFGNNDVQITSMTSDAFGLYGVYIENVAEAGTIEIIGGQYGAAPGASAGIRVQNSGGQMAFHGGQILVGVSPGCTAIQLDTCKRVQILGTQISEVDTAAGIDTNNISQCVLQPSLNNAGKSGGSAIRMFGASSANIIRPIVGGKAGSAWTYGIQCVGAGHGGNHIDVTGIVSSTLAASRLDINGTGITAAGTYSTNVVGGAFN